MQIKLSIYYFGFTKDRQMREVHLIRRIISHSWRMHTLTIVIISPQVRILRCGFRIWDSRYWIPVFVSRTWILGSNR